MAAPDHAQRLLRRFPLHPRGRPHMPVRHARAEALAAGAASMAARHVRRCPGFVPSTGSGQATPGARGQDRVGHQTRPPVGSGCPAGPARPRGPSFFARDAVPAEVAPERCHIGRCPLRCQSLLQLRQGDVGRVGEGCRDQAGMGIRAVRKAITALRSRPAIAASAAQSLPADRARHADPEPAHTATVMSSPGWNTCHQGSSQAGDWNGVALSLRCQSAHHSGSKRVKSPARLISVVSSCAWNDVIRVKLPSGDV